MQFLMTDGKRVSFVFKRKNSHADSYRAGTPIHTGSLFRRLCIRRTYVDDSARYAPFYIDLVDYFSFENAALYHKALTSRGFSLNLKDFEERFRAAFRYPCFIYMFPSIIQWKNGSEERLLKLLHRLFSC